MISIVHELRKASGTNKKLQILKRYKNNDTWKQFLHYTYNPFINFHVSAQDSINFVGDLDDYSGMFNILDSLSDRTFTGNSARQLAYEGSEKYGEIFRLALKRSINAGISTTTINKAYPKLIPEFNVMLAVNQDPVTYPVYASIKYDGVRCIVFVNKDSVEVLTRAGKKIYIPGLEKEMSQAPSGVYDGELVDKQGKQNNRTTISGFVNKSLKGASISYTDYHYVIFDYLTICEWTNQKSSTMYSDRYSFISDEFSKDKYEYCKPIVQSEVFNKDDIDSMFRILINDGFEGLILRYKDDPYVWKRSPSLLKVKSTKECVLTCVGTIEGNGKYAGMIGAISCIGELQGVPIKVDIGSGLSDYDRDKAPEEYEGKSIEILYNDIVSNKNNPNVYSLFLPRFKRIVGGI
jgi:DNA ligase-1